MDHKFKILSEAFLKEYEAQLPIHLHIFIRDLKEKDLFKTSDFEFYIQSSATYSSNIEGNSIDIDTYLKNKKFKIKSKPKEMAEIDELITAYNFAMNHTLDFKNFLETHKILSKTILSLKSQRGKLRNQQVGIFSRGKLEYMAVEPEFVKAEIDKLFADIVYLLSIELNSNEVFYYASMIHLMFEKIHPFMDGNGRAGRLLEKWFLSEKLGKNLWSISSEMYYAIHRSDYYQNIHIGEHYYQLYLERCVPFLLMLPKSIVTNEKGV